MRKIILSNEVNKSIELGILNLMSFTIDISRINKVITTFCFIDAKLFKLYTVKEKNVVMKLKIFELIIAIIVNNYTFVINFVNIYVIGVSLI